MKKLSILTLTIFTGLYTFSANAVQVNGGGPKCYTQLSCEDKLVRECSSITKNGQKGHLLLGTIEYTVTSTFGGQSCYSCEATCEAGGATFKVKEENSSTKEIINSKIRTPSKTVTAREIK